MVKILNHYIIIISQQAKKERKGERKNRKFSFS